MENWRVALGARLREARLGVPLTQVQFAECLAVDQTTVSRWERGYNAPRDELRPRIANLVGRPIQDLFTYDELNGDEGQAA